MHAERVIVVIELQLELDLRVGHITIFNRCKEIGNFSMLMHYLAV